MVGTMSTSSSSPPGVAAPMTPTGPPAVTVALGPEELLAERAIADVVTRARALDPAMEVERVDAVELSPAALTGLLSPSLFSAARVVVVDGAELARSEVSDALAEAADQLPDESRLVVRHAGGARGRGLVDRLRRAGATVVSCERPRTGDLPAFVAEEVRRAGGSIARDAALLLVDAVGTDLRSLSAAAGQLVSDAMPAPAADRAGQGTPGHRPSAGDDGESAPPVTPAVTRSLVATYYGGHAQVSGFAIADAVLEGHTAQAVDRLRWALRAGVAPVLVVSAIAAGVRSLLRYSGLPPGSGEAEAARTLGVPPWKVRTVRGQSAAWPPAALAQAQVAVAEADAAVKGAGGDAGFAVERLLMRLSGLLRETSAGSRRRR